ncbi:MAG: hypothetical protein LBR98_00035 [Syntrophomonadaceae bacterium]|nr:hypothetical protein [Syntrophomonadaceae bacterium]
MMALSVYIYYGGQLRKEIAISRNLTAQIGEFATEFSDNSPTEWLEAQQRKDGQLKLLTGMGSGKITLIMNLEKIITDRLRITTVEISDKIILSGTAGSYSDISQLVSGLRSYPELNILNFRAGDQLSAGGIDFRIELERKGTD